MNRDKMHVPFPMGRVKFKEMRPLVSIGDTQTQAVNPSPPEARIAAIALVWDVNDVASYLRCTIRHVRKLTSLGRLPYSKVGRLVRYSPAKIAEWVEKGGTR